MVESGGAGSGAPGDGRRLPPELDPRGPRRRNLPPRNPPPPGNPPAGGPRLAGRPPRNPGRSGASATERPGRRRRVVRVLSWVAVLTSLIVLATSGTLYAAYLHYGGRIASLPGLGRLADGTGGVSRAENYLLVGSDSGDNLTNAQLKEVGANRSGRDGVRTDTIILVHIPADGRQAKFISFPRDSFVHIPGHPDNKINSAFATGERERPGGGPAKLVQTVQVLTGQHIDHYLQVSLFGFYTITNAVGGVDVCLSRPAKEPKANIDLPAGRQTLDGKNALAFVRQRYGLPDGDLSRIRRQQYFLGAATRKILSAGVLLNPLRLNALLNAAGDSLKVDPGTSRKDLLDLALRMRSLSAGKVKFQTVPVAGTAARDVPGQRAASVVLLDEAALPGFFAGLDDKPSASPSSAPALTVPASSVAVTVENGTGRPGLARKVGSALTGVGFRLNQVRSAQRTDYTDTVVRYGADRGDSARTVVAAIPGSVAQADPSLPPSGLVVDVGSSYSGVKPVKVTSGRSPSASPSSSASSAPTTTAADKGCIV